LRHSVHYTNTAGYTGTSNDFYCKKKIIICPLPYYSLVLKFWRDLWDPIVSGAAAHFDSGIQHWEHHIVPRHSLVVTLVHSLKNSVNKFPGKEYDIDIVVLKNTLLESNQRFLVSAPTTNSFITFQQSGSEVDKQTNKPRQKCNLLAGGNERYSLDITSSLQSGSVDNNVKRLFIKLSPNKTNKLIASFKQWTRPTAEHFLDKSFNRC